MQRCPRVGRQACGNEAVVACAAQQFRLERRKQQFTLFEHAARVRHRQRYVRWHLYLRVNGVDQIRQFVRCLQEQRARGCIACEGSFGHNPGQLRELAALCDALALDRGA